jgi:hypothetical protein
MLSPSPPSTVSPTGRLGRLAAVTPITLKSFSSGPVYPHIRVSGSVSGSELKHELYVRLEAHGVTCDRILDILDDVRARPDRLAAWVSVVTGPTPG